MSNEVEIQILNELKNMNNRMDSMEKRMDSMEQSMNSKIDAINNRMDSMEQSMNSKIDAINNRMDSMEQNINDHMNLMENRINRRITILEQEHKEMNQKMDIMMAELMRNSEQHTATNVEVEEVKNDVKEVKIDVDKLKHKTDQINEKIEQKTDIVVGILNQLLEKSADNTARINSIEQALEYNGLIPV